MAKKKDVLKELGDLYTTEELQELVLLIDEDAEPADPDYKYEIEPPTNTDVLKQILKQLGHVSIPPQEWARDVQGSVNIRVGNGDIIINLKK